MAGRSKKNREDSDEEEEEDEETEPRRKADADDNDEDDEGSEPDATQKGKGKAARGEKSEVMVDAERIKRRETRKKYRTLQAQVDETRGNLRDVEVSTMLAQVQNANLLFKDIERPAEAVLDSHVLMAASDAGALKVRQLKVDADAFDSDDFIVKLIQFLGGRLPGADGKGGKRKRRDGEDEDEEEDELMAEGAGTGELKWEKVGKVLGKYSKRVPVIDFMYGPLDIEVKAKRAIVRQAKQKIDPSQHTRPEQIESGDITKDPQETTKMVAAIAKVLETYGEGGIAFLRFIINPDSFAQSVENMFYFSFLVREGKAAIEFEDNRQSQYCGDAIAFTTDPADQDDIARGGKKHQLIFELTQEVWKGAIDAYKLTESNIPTRAEVVKAPGKGGKGWH